LLIVPQEGDLLLETELGRLHLQPREVAVVPRGVRFRVRLPEGKPARGYVCENFGVPLGLPPANGGVRPADPADFQFPVAWYEDVEGRCELVCKFLNRTWSAQMMHSPLDVVAWRGNYAPYKYDLRHFHPADEAARTSFLAPVLTSPGGEGGDALQFVVFPPRWSVAEHAFPAPWYHRNVASEFMGLVAGAYEARAGGFVPGGSSLHNCMIGHGPDAAAWERLRAAASGQPSAAADAPAEPALAFMFETRMPLHLSRQALECDELQSGYQEAWQGLKKHFTGTR
jgi:homogentisate 1,2-dioxygenase